MTLLRSEHFSLSPNCQDPLKRKNAKMHVPQGSSLLPATQVPHSLHTVAPVRWLLQVHRGWPGKADRALGGETAGGLGVVSG
jgi:hypothetical protein